MGMEIYCRKTVSDREHTYWCLRLPNTGKYYISSWDDNEFEISYMYDPEERELTWGGWSLKRRDGAVGYAGLADTPLNNMNEPSKDLDALKRVLPLWKNGAEPRYQAAWTRWWDDGSEWYVS